MREFEFSLQTALDLRRREEEAALRRLAQARRVASGIRAELRETQGRHDDLVGALRGSGFPGTRTPDLQLGDARALAIARDLTEVEHAHRYLGALRHLMARQRDRLQQADRVCDQRQTEVLAASRARKTLERLAGRRKAEHRTREARRERRELDEVAVCRHRLLQAEARHAAPADDG